MTTDSIKIWCTDRDQYVDGYLLQRRDGQFLEAVINTVKVKMLFERGKYIGNMAGFEFVVKSSDLPELHREPLARRK